LDIGTYSKINQLEGEPYVERSVKFYTEKLGLNLIDRDVNSEQSDEWGCDEYSILELEGGNLELIRLDKSNKQTSDEIYDFTPPYCPHLALTTNNMNKTLEMIKERGVRIIRGPLEIKGWTKWVYVCDPDGNQIEIVQWF
jgi:lactoylglutathione lyase